MLNAQPPYSLAPTTFPFPALASLAGRSPLGGAREVALGCLVACRLASALVKQSVPGSTRLARVSAARSWLASLNLPAAARGPLNRLIEVSGGDSLPAAAAAVRKVTDVTALMLDVAARSELVQLAEQLESA
jgi:hypothetical protein